MEISQQTKYISIGVAAALILVGAGIGIGRLMFGNAPDAGMTPATFTIATTTAADSSHVQPAAAAAPADKLAACEASVQAAAAKQGTGYDKGDILVSFNADITYAEALAILDSNGLKLHNSASSKTDFATNHWLQAAVTSGAEIKEVCVLRGEQGIKYAGLNYTFNLAQ